MDFDWDAPVTAENTTNDIIANITTNIIANLTVNPSVNITNEVIANITTDVIANLTSTQTNQTKPVEKTTTKKAVTLKKKIVTEASKNTKTQTSTKTLKTTKTITVVKKIPPKITTAKKVVTAECQTCKYTKNKTQPKMIARVLRGPIMLKKASTKKYTTKPVRKVAVKFTKKNIVPLTKNKRKGLSYARIIKKANLKTTKQVLRVLTKKPVITTTRKIETSMVKLEFDFFN